MTGPDRLVRVADIMGTAISVHVIVDDAAVAAQPIEDAVAASFAELTEIDRLFSPYRPESELCRIQRGGLAFADADPRFAEVAAACADAQRATGGAFSAQWSGLFDPTGYVKGWAIENAARRHLAPLVDRPGVRAVGMNAGGDMQLSTSTASDWRWRVGIADPFHPGEVIATLELRDGAVATSGSAERGAHIVDPRTGQPATGLVAATVVADSLAIADVWATAAIVAGAEAGWGQAVPARSVLTVADDGRVRRWALGVEITQTAPAWHPHPGSS